jgi:hypothetical protein
MKKDVEEFGRGLFGTTIQALVRKDRRKIRKPPVSVVDTLAFIRTRCHMNGNREFKHLSRMLGVN